jgi:hypothetical protein
LECRGTSTIPNRDLSLSTNFETFDIKTHRVWAIQFILQFWGWNRFLIQMIFQIVFNRMNLNHSSMSHNWWMLPKRFNSEFACLYVSLTTQKYSLSFSHKSSFLDEQEDEETNSNIRSNKKIQLYIFSLHIKCNCQFAFFSFYKKQISMELVIKNTCDV